jgi:hypothetical protein
MITNERPKGDPTIQLAVHTEITSGSRSHINPPNICKYHKDTNLAFKKEINLSI